MACTADHHKYMENFMESKTSQWQIWFFQSIYNSANCISQTSCQKQPHPIPGNCSLQWNESNDCQPSHDNI